MATILSEIESESYCFSGSPIVLKVTSGVTEPANKLVQVRINVSSTLFFYGSRGTKLYTFRAETGPGGVAVFDISSVARARLAEVELEPVMLETGDSFRYPYVGLSVSAYDECINENGEYTVSIPAAGPTFSAILGTLPALERMDFNADVHHLITSSNFSRKPDYGVWGRGDWVITSRQDGASDGISSVKTIISESLAVLPDNHRQFMFINSMGVFETVSAIMRESLSYSLESKTFNLFREPSFKTYSDRSTHKTPPRQQYIMSSGHVSRPWADWWASEFLAAKKYWVRMQVPAYYTSGSSVSKVAAERWVPCVVTPVEDAVLVYDRAEQRLPHVDFNVLLSVDGSNF